MKSWLEFKFARISLQRASNNQAFFDEIVFVTFYK